MGGKYNASGPYRSAKFRLRGAVQKLRKLNRRTPSCNPYSTVLRVADQKEVALNEVQSFIELQEPNEESRVCLTGSRIGRIRDAVPGCGLVPISLPTEPFVYIGTSDFGNCGGGRELTCPAVKLAAYGVTANTVVAGLDCLLSTSDAPTTWEIVVGVFAMTFIAVSCIRCCCCRTPAARAAIMEKLEACSARLCGDGPEAPRTTTVVHDSVVPGTQPEVTQPRVI